MLTENLKNLKTNFFVEQFLFRNQSIILTLHVFNLSFQSLKNKQLNFDEIKNKDFEGLKVYNSLN